MADLPPKPTKCIINKANVSNCLYCHIQCRPALEGEEEGQNTIDYHQDITSINPNGICSCDHSNHDNKDIMNLLFSNDTPFTRDTMIAYNNLLMTEDKVYDQAFQESIVFLNADREALVNDNFRWEDIDVATIVGKRSLILDIVNIKVPQEIHRLLNLAPLHQILDPKLIEAIMDQPNYSFGTPIYNRSLDFYTQLLEYFILHFLERDFSGLDKIYAEEIETLSPLTRIEIREKNLRNTYIQEKYFGTQPGDFNVHKFTLNVIDKFVPGASWRFIGGKHKCHYLGVKISKILIEHGLLSDIEIEQVLDVMYQKIPIFIRLEELVNIDSDKIDHKWINVWKDGFMELREYFIEILIHQVYARQDKEVLKMLTKLAERAEETFTLKEAEKIISFQKTVLFEQEFGKKVLDFLLGYILSQNMILGKFLTSPKVEQIAINFLYIFSNTQDPYLQSLKLLDPNNVLLFLEKRRKAKGISSVVSDVERQLNTLSSDTANGVYAFEEEKAMDRLSEILGLIISALEHDSVASFSQLGIKMDINSSGVFSSVLSLFSLYSDILESKRPEVFGKLMEFIEMYLKGNSEGHCIFFQTYNFDILLKFLKIFPQELSDTLHEIMRMNIDVAVIDSGQLQMLIELTTTVFASIDETSKERYYKSGIVLMKTLQLFLDYKKYKDLTALPDYDKQVAEMMAKFTHLADKGLIMRKMEEKEFNDSNSPDFLKFSFSLEFLITFMSSIYWRFTYESFMVVKKFFGLEDLFKLVSWSGDYFKFRNVFLEFLDIIYMDPKNELLNSRHLLTNEIVLEKEIEEVNNSLNEEEKNEEINSIINQEQNIDQEPVEEEKKEEQKPIPEQVKTDNSKYWYEGTMYYETGYEDIINFFISEIDFMISTYKSGSHSNYTADEFSNYSNDQIMASVLKLTLYFSLIRNEEAEKIAKFAEPLKRLEDKLISSTDSLNEIFKTEAKANPAPKDKYRPSVKGDIEGFESIRQGEVEMSAMNLTSSYTQKLVVKRLSLSIYSLTSTFVKGSDLHHVKSKRNPHKPMTQRLYKTTRVVKSFSNYLSIRKEILDSKSSSLEKLNIVEVLVRSYEKFKIEKLSTRKDENVYIAPLNNENNIENQRFCKNLCVFTINQLSNDWSSTQLSYNYKIIECLCNCLFISTESMQKNLHAALKEKDANKDFDMFVLNKIWYHMLELMDYVKFKTTIDRVWKENFHRCLLFIKFHQFLCEDVSVLFKGIMGGAMLPEENAPRVKMLMRAMDSLTDTFGWAKHYTEDSCSPFPHSQRPHLMLLGVFIFDLLEELTSGPYFDNQKIVYRMGYSSIRGLLNRYDEDINSDFYKVKLSLLNFLLAVMEGKNEMIVDVHTRELELSMLAKVMISSLRQLFAVFIKKRKLQKIDELNMTFKDIKTLEYFYDSNPAFANNIMLEIAVKIFSYIRLVAIKRIKYFAWCEERTTALSEYKDFKEWTKILISEEELVVFKFLNSIVNKVEVVRDDSNKLEELYYMVPAKCEYLSDDTKLNFPDKIDRSSHDTKLVGLLNRTQFFNAEMSHTHKIFVDFSWFFSIFGTGGFLYFLQMITICFTFIINVLLLVNFQMKPGDKRQYNGNYEDEIRGFAILIIVLSGIGLVFWFFTESHLVRLIEKEEFKVRHQNKLSLNKMDLIYVAVYKSFLRDGDAFAFLMHLVCCILALTVSPAFFGIELLTIVNASLTLQLLVKSTTAHISQLVATYVLGLILMYVYSLFAQIYFFKAFKVLGAGDVMRQTLDDGRTQETKCDSLLHCFLTILGWAFANNQGIGLMMQSESFTSHNYKLFYARIVFEISFFLLINIILLNILMGIIIDTFRELREAARSKRDDMESRCFICGIEEYRFARQGIPFKKHVKNEHNIWNYVNFLVYMRGKTLKDCNGVQGEIYQKIIENNLDWFPIGRSLSLEKVEEYHDPVSIDSLQKKIRYIGAQLDAVNKD